MADSDRGAHLPSENPFARPRGVDAVLDHWLSSNRVKPCLTADDVRAPKEATVSPFPARLHPRLRAALEGRGIDALYSHQARAFEAAHDPKNRAVVVATPTASGKSLCFHLPVLQALLEDRDARAIYLYPTKALSRDQEAGLQKMMQEADIKTGAVVYDGDTPGDARRAARERSGIVLTNPDMLHAGILPHHTQWARTFQHLGYVVVDEMHMYRGVFGSHVANVLRRLLRIAAFHGSHPMLIGATATIGNPREHGAALFGIPEEQVAFIGESGAPQGERRFFSFNPPVVNAELGIRASYVKQAVYLAKDLVLSGVPTLVFGQSRNNVEVMLKYLREYVSPHVPRDKVMGYRGGYLPQQRRDIEERLRSGDILCVIATNALELGIDIGELDAVVCAGYPGSIAALWQRMGRAGRRGKTSICVLVTSSAPLDQYLAREPKYLLGAPIEEARVEPENPEILIQHLKCASFELPFRLGDKFGQLEAIRTEEALRFLVTHQVLHESGGAFHWANEAYPANHVSLRTVGWDNVVIIDVEHGKTIAEIDFRAAHTMVHEQAIYQHDGECWQVERFDYENHKAYIRKVVPDYFTDAMTFVSVTVLEEADLGANPVAILGHGEVSVVEKVVGYKKVKFFTHENAGYGEVRLPEIDLHTTAFWVTLAEPFLATVPEGRAAAIDALRGVGLALETVATLALLCEPRDLGTTLGRPESLPADLLAAMVASAGRNANADITGLYNPTLFLYEHTPGGLGLAGRIFENRNVLLGRTRELVGGCPCPDGCPSCVGPGQEGPSAGRDGTSKGRKALALHLLDALVPRSAVAGEDALLAETLA
jgi:DEAD/DEAH box helicase domain-containing protein